MKFYIAVVAFRAFWDV